ncbi:MAG TPA: hypothetical protein PKC30_14505 [Saprospiraceae bacterium]|nr:hypothetical protein [Saprospiraceae bacterium]
MHISDIILPASGTSSCTPSKYAYTGINGKLFTVMHSKKKYFTMLCLPDKDNPLLSPYFAFIRKQKHSDEMDRAWGHDDSPYKNKDGSAKSFTIHSQSTPYKV